MHQRLAEHAAQQRAAILRFAAELVATPSPSGDEEAVATLVRTKLQELGCDEAFTDEVGNVVGVIRGQGTGPRLLFCSHMDHADPGDLELWDHPPHTPTEQDGYLLGVGASDSKGALAAQVFAALVLKHAGVRLAGDVLVAGVVMAERAEAFGLSHLMDHTLPSRGLQPTMVVMGDPTGLDIFLGQRGRMEIEVTTIGRTAHAATPGLGVNAAYQMLPVLAGLRDLATTLPSHPFLGKSTLAVTNLQCAPARQSLLPDRCVAAVDRWYLPSEPLDAVLMQVRSLVSREAARDPEFRGEARIRTVTETAYTGVSKEVPKVLPPFVTSEAHPLVQRAVHALQALGETPRFDTWCFSTEGGYAAHVTGLPTFGYGPGEEQVSHTPYDRVSIDRLMRCVVGTAAIAQAIAGEE